MYSTYFYQSLFSALRPGPILFIISIVYIFWALIINSQYHDLQYPHRSPEVPCLSGLPELYSLVCKDMCILSGRCIRVTLHNHYDLTQTICTYIFLTVDKTTRDNRMHYTIQVIVQLVYSRVTHCLLLPLFAKGFNLMCMFNSSHISFPTQQTAACSFFCKVISFFVFFIVLSFSRSTFGSCNKTS